MATTGPLKWHGGKQYLARRIVELMPPHLHYVEPFFGGGAVLLAKDPEGVSEVANDINADLMNFWSVLQNKPLFEAFCRTMQVTPFAEPEYYAYQEVLAQSPPDIAYELATGIKDPRAATSVAMACAFFVCCRQSLAGRMDAFAPLSRTRTRRGMNEQASAWLNAVEGLPTVHSRLKRVVILNHDAFDVIKQQDGPDTLFYLDPPYLHETRAGTGEYAHEMTGADHHRLVGNLWKLKAKVMLSGYRSDLYDAHISSWNRHDFDLPNNASGGGSKRRMTECLWCNF